MIVIAIFAIIGNSSVTGTNNINDQFAKLNCPTPIYSGIDFLNGTIRSDATFLAHNPYGYGSYYQCAFDPHTMAFGRQGVTTITASYNLYNATAYTAFPQGAVQYIGDFLASLMFKVGAVENLVAYILTPINFNLLGYTLASVSGLILMAIIAIYILAYMPIAILIYKSVSPFASGL